MYLSISFAVRPRCLPLPTRLPSLTVPLDSADCEQCTRLAFGRSARRFGADLQLAKHVIVEFANQNLSH